MMGLQAAPEQLFYDFCFEDHVPSDHQLRRIDDFLDLDDIRPELERDDFGFTHIRRQRDSLHIHPL